MVQCGPSIWCRLLLEGCATELAASWWQQPSEWPDTRAWLCLLPIPVCAVGDIYPDAVQLKKGDYVIRAILRHDDAQLLDKLKVRGVYGIPW